MRQHRLYSGLKLRTVARNTGISAAQLSGIERGYELPPDEKVAALELYYGPAATWYPATVRRALHHEKICPGCGYPLGADASRRRMYHSEACRGRARRRAA